MIKPLYRGDTRTLKVTITDGAGVPIDITGHKLYFTLKANKTDADIAAALQVSALMPTGANSTAGIGYLTITSADTNSVTPGRYYYDIQWVQPGPVPFVKTMDEGRVRVLADITRTTS